MKKKYRCNIRFRTTTKNLRLIEHFSHLLHVPQEELLNKMLSLLDGNEADIMSVLGNIKPSPWTAGPLLTRHFSE